jgi:F-type H+-transporting ATPase subunit O
LIRSYAVAASTKGIKPPITIHTLEGTYASALFSSAAANPSTLNEIEKSLATIRQKLDKDAKLSSVVVNPALSHKEKLDVIKLLTLFGGVGGEASKAVHNLLEVLSENGRLGHLDGVVAAFTRIMRAHKGEVDVVVTSAQVRSSILPCSRFFIRYPSFGADMQPLDSRVLQRLEQSISKSSLLQRGQRVKMENKVLPGVLG